MTLRNTWNKWRYYYLILRSKNCLQRHKRSSIMIELDATNTERLITIEQTVTTFTAMMTKLDVCIERWYRFHNVTYRYTYLNAMGGVEHKTEVWYLINPQFALDYIVKTHPNYNQLKIFPIKEHETTDTLA